MKVRVKFEKIILAIGSWRVKFYNRCIIRYDDLLQDLRKIIGGEDEIES